MSGEFGPGGVYNHRVTKHIKELLPDRPQALDNYRFGGTAILDSQRHPGRPAGGKCKLEAYVGTDGQITVLEQSRIASDGDILWAVQNRVRRTHAVDGASMEPFAYDVTTRLKSGDETKRDTATVCLDGFTDRPVYGGHEVQAAVLLAEKIAVRKESSAAPSEEICCSLHDFPSLSRVIHSTTYVDLTWEELNDLLGPEADTIAATAPIDLLQGEERREAESKGLEIFSEDVDGQAKEALEYRAGSGSDGDARDSPERAGVATQLPDGMDPEEATERLQEVVAEIQRMKENQ